MLEMERHSTPCQNNVIVSVSPIKDNNVTDVFNMSAFHHTCCMSKLAQFIKFFIGL